MFWIEGVTRSLTPLSTLKVAVSATDPDTAAASLKTSFGRWTLYDQPFNTININKDVSDRFIWTQNGPNPQPCTINAKLNSTNFPSGVYKVEFFANDSKLDSPVSEIFYSVDNPAINDRPYLKGIPSIAIRENDVTFINLDKYGIDPDRNKNTIGKLTYEIVSITPQFAGIRLCGTNPLTNNVNYILKINPQVGDARKTVTVTIKVSDGGTPALSFERKFNITILPKGTTAAINNPSNLPGCEGDEDLLEIESATLISLPKGFNLFDLNIPNVSKALVGDPLILDKFTQALGRVLTKKKFEGHLIGGGRAHVVLQLKPVNKLQQSDLKHLSVAVRTKLDNKETNVITSVISYNEITRELLLEIKLPDFITPGEAALIINNTKGGKSKAIGRTTITILPSVVAKSIVTKDLIGKPVVLRSDLYELGRKENTKNTKKQYLLIVTGKSFIKRTVSINNTLITSPLVYQPFSLITLTNLNGITIQRMRVTRNENDTRRTKMEILFEYDTASTPASKDIRYFTVTTLVGQDTGSVDLKTPQKPPKDLERF